MPYFDPNWSQSLEGVRKWSGCQKTGNYLNFSEKNSNVDFGHFGPCFEQQTQNRVFFAQQVPYAFVGQKVVKSGQNRAQTHFFVKFRSFPVFWHPDHYHSPKTRKVILNRKIVIFDFFTKNAIFVVLTRIDIRAQKELESGQGVKKLEIIWIFQKKILGSILGIFREVMAKNGPVAQNRLKGRGGFKIHPQLGNFSPNRRYNPNRWVMSKVSIWGPKTVKNVVRRKKGLIGGG